MNLNSSVNQFSGTSTLSNPDAKFKKLRDDFAGIAMLGLLNNIDFPIRDIPEHAYRIADGMLKERLK